MYMLKLHYLSSNILWKPFFPSSAVSDWLWNPEGISKFKTSFEKSEKVLWIITRNDWGKLHILKDQQLVLQKLFLNYQKLLFSLFHDK